MKRELSGESCLTLSVKTDNKNRNRSRSFKINLLVFLPHNFSELIVNDFYKLLFWVANPLDAFAVGSDLRREIWKRFEKEGITIPFPQRQVYPMKWPPSLQKSLNTTTTAERNEDCQEQESAG